MLRQIEENITLASETLHAYDQSNQEGIFVLIDQTKAFDKVQWDFTCETVSAFGYPDEFISIIRTLYFESSIRLKVNGKIGEKYTISNGLRQGCSVSALLYLFPQEVLLRMIRQNKNIKGLTIPGPTYGTTKELKERGMADDTATFLGNTLSIAPLIHTLQRFQSFSKHEVNLKKNHRSTARQTKKACRCSQPGGPDHAKHRH